MNGYKSESVVISYNSLNCRQKYPVFHYCLQIVFAKIVSKLQEELCHFFSFFFFFSKIFASALNDPPTQFTVQVLLVPPSAKFQVISLQDDLSSKRCSDWALCLNKHRLKENLS